MKSKYSIADRRVEQLLLDLRDLTNTEITSVNQIARVIKKEFNFPQEQDFIRSYVRRMNKKFKEQDKPSFRKEVANQLGITETDLGITWAKTKQFSAVIKPKGIDLEKVYERFEDIVKNYKFKQRKLYKSKGKEFDKTALKTIITDEHIGMDVGEGLFDYEYNRDIYQEKFNGIFPRIYNKYKLYNKFDVILIDNLGDIADGYKGQTERGGHHLPHNIDEDEVAEIVLKNRLDLIDNILHENITDKIVLRNVLNSNHAGTLDGVINRALRFIINRFYDDEVVKIDNFKQFIEYREYGVHGFANTHGKDTKYMKYGLPLILNEKSENWLNKYFDSLKINAKYLHVDKGDLHQVGYEKKKRFDYRNYMSFAPPSPYVQLNYGDTYSGYSMQVIPKYSNEIDHTDIYLNYEKNKKEVICY